MKSERATAYLSAAAMLAGILAIIAGDAPAQSSRGATVFMACAACHNSPNPAAPSVGPSLRGIYGKRAGSQRRYSYSRALKEAGAAGLVWNDKNLHAYLANPRGFIAGNRMAFGGIKSRADRNAVINYLKNLPAGGKPRQGRGADSNDPSLTVGDR